MYVSVTGLKPKGPMGWLRFWRLTVPASKAAQKADGIRLCEFRSHKGFQHTLTVWASKEKMSAYVSSDAHVKAMKGLSKIGVGKVYGYETDAIPSWDDALAEWDKNGRVY